jgi:hypothetical protein
VIDIEELAAFGGEALIDIPATACTMRRRVGLLTR